MSSKHTVNYQLCQWEAEDKVLRTDFNEDNAKIDSAIKAVDRRVDGLSSTVAGQGSSLSSQSGAIAKLGNCQIYTAAFTGDGAVSKTFTFPGYPVFVRVQETETAVSVDFLRGAKYTTGSYSKIEIPLTWSAQGLTWSSAGGQSVPMNHSGTSYTLFALLDMSK